MITQLNLCLRFPTRFNSGDDNIKNSIVTFAANKLLCRSSKSNTELMAPESLVCLAVRLGLDFKATSWLDSASECTQVERHMRICLAATDGFRTMITISPSEPLLAEASSLVMRQCLGPKEAPTALLKHINDSYLNAGDRGEVVGALLLLLARDSAAQDRETSSHIGVSQMDLTNDGITQGRVVTILDFLDALVPPDRRPFVRGQMPIRCAPGHSSEPLARAFARASLYFNHFIKVHDAKMVNRKYLWRLFCRGAAVICANNQRGVDIIIPVLMGNILDPKFITAILIQVKNDGHYTDNLCISLFDTMDPFAVELFSKTDGAPFPPVLRIVFALASEKSAVTAPNHPTRHSARLASEDEFTAYDLWIAGVSSQSFGVVPNDQTYDVYRHLLDRTRNVFNGYRMISKVADALTEFEQSRIDMRRMMHAAAASGDIHYQNYIRDLSEAPSNRKYIVDQYYENHVGMDMDGG